MLNSRSVFLRNILSFTVPAILFSTIIFLIKNVDNQNLSAMSIAISIDLLIVIPLIYFLFIRKTKIPNSTVIPIFVIGLFIGTYFLPIENQPLLNIFKIWALPLIELFIFTYIFYKIRKVLKAYKNEQIKHHDFYDVLKTACTEIIPIKIVPFVATEIAVFYYGFIKWKKIKPTENGFTVHQNTSSILILGVLLFLIAVETFALHLLLASWNKIFAWVLTGLSIYTALQVFGFMKSIIHRRILIENHQLILRYGIINEIHIPLKNIQMIEQSSTQLDKNQDNVMLSALSNLEGQNILITLVHSQELKQLYGFKKACSTIGIHIDEPNQFAQLLEAKLNSIKKP